MFEPPTITEILEDYSNQTVIERCPMNDEILEDKLDELERENASIRQQLRELKMDVDNLKDDIRDLKNDIRDLERAAQW